MNNKVCVFIDGSNFFHSLKYECGNTKIDFEKFVNWLVGHDRQLIRTYYYNAAVRQDKEPARAKDQQKFFDRLRKISYFDIRLGRLEPRGGTFVEKGVDVSIAVDMLSMAIRNIYDVAILVSCDGDFAKAVKEIQDLGKHVEVACFRKAYHLKGAADKVIALNPMNLSPFLPKKKSGKK